MTEKTPRGTPSPSPGPPPGYGTPARPVVARSGAYGER
jgi:hypothetical protein